MSADEQDQGGAAASDIRVMLADLSDEVHAADALAMVDTYSRDPMGDGAALPDDVRMRLVPGLRDFPTTRVFLAYDGSTAVGIAVCFLGFSTFAAKPLINLHDVCVAESHRGRGVWRALLGAIEAHGLANGCCKLTLEVLDQNHRALRAYESAGFQRYSLQDGAGEAIFMTKSLN